MGTIKIFVEVNKPTQVEIKYMVRINECGESELRERLKVITNSEEYESNIRCHNYAFKNYIGFTEANSIFNEEVLKRQKVKSFKKIRKGDIIFYYDKDYKKVIHYGVVYKTHEMFNKIVIHSKWGTFDVFEHTIFKCPYRDTSEVFFMSKGYKHLFGEEKIIKW